MKREASFEKAWEKTQKIIDAAIAAGTHSTNKTYICGVCGRDVESIYHVGEDGTRMCPACADNCGHGPESFLRRQQQLRQRGAVGR